MCSMVLRPLSVALLWAVFWSVDLCAQQATVTTPFHSASEGFFEHVGSSWGLSGKNWFFSFGGGPTQAAPQFGGFDPSAGANFGFGFEHGGTSGFFSANWSQGNRRSFVTQAPSLTLQNGVLGFVGELSLSPFVVGYVPVLGGFPAVMHYDPAPFRPGMATGPGASATGHDAVVNALRAAQAGHNPLGKIQDKPLVGDQAAGVPPPNAPDVQAPPKHDDLVLAGSPASPDAAAALPAKGAVHMLAAAQPSSAGRPVPSVAAARRLYAAEQAAQREQALQWLQRARHAAATGKPNVAKVYYQMAARRAKDPLREEILSRIQALSGHVGASVGPPPAKDKTQRKN
jgi:hypothetical protein